MYILTIENPKTKNVKIVIQFLILDYIRDI